MAYGPISLSILQYEDYATYWLKAYEQGTTTPLVMATDVTGGTTLAKCEIDAQGFPITAGSARFTPFINGNYDLWLFPTAAEADANDTSNAIQFADNLNADPQQVTITDTDGMYNGSSLEEILAEVNSSVDDYTALRAIEPTVSVGEKKSIYVRGYATPGDGGEGYFYWDSTDTTDDDDGTFLKVTAVTTGRWLRNYSGAVNVKWFGAKGDKSTDDLASFLAAIPVANRKSMQLYVPGLKLGFFYRITDELLFNSRQSFHFFGDGISSLILIDNNAGANAVTINLSVHFQMSNLGISGLSGSGHGIEITGGTNNARFNNIYIGHVDGDGLRITEGQSNTFSQMGIDEDSGYRPAFLLGGQTEGNMKRGVYVKHHAAGLNNNNTFINCKLNSASGTEADEYCLQVGDSGGSVDSFAWYGGLIQGASDYQEIYLRARDSIISGAHIEPKTGATSNYSITMEGCTNSIVEKCVISGDILLTGNNFACGIENARINGVDISATSRRIFIRDCLHSNIVTGPTGGAIKDKAPDTELINLTNASNTRYHTGRRPTTINNEPYFHTTMEYWVGSSNPCGMAVLGSPTITKDTGTVKHGTNSVKIITTANNTQGLTISIFPNELFKDTSSMHNKWVTAEAWVYVTTGIARVQGDFGGSGAQVQQSSQTTGQWEKIVVTFTPDTTDTSMRVELVGSSGATFYVDSLTIHTSMYDRQLFKDDSSATPNLSSASTSGQFIPFINCTGTTTITGFDGPHVGKPFTLIFDDAKTVNDSATVQLVGGANFVASANDTLTLVYCDDSIFREISRSVN